MTQAKGNHNNTWLYQRIALASLAIAFIVYGLLLRMPMYFIAMVLIWIAPSILNPRHVCRAIPITKYIYINYCGALLPLLIATVILLQNLAHWLYIFLALLFSITLSALHTYVTNKFVLVNVPRYFIAVTSTALALFESSIVYSLLPFTIVAGLIVGADLVSYITTSLWNKDRKKIVIGGFMALDSINLSLVFSLIILIIVKFLFIY
jgi:hypothetical protein